MSSATLAPGASPVAPPASAVGPTAADLPELIDRLGGIPANRVRMWPVPGTATKADAIHSALWYGAACELIDGTLVEKPIGPYESGVAQAIGLAIGIYSLPRKLGFIGGEQGMCNIVPDQLRMPDASFTLWDRMPVDDPANPAPDVSPDLAVEVLSPSNTAREIERKQREHFARGARLVWVFDPPTRTVAVCTPEDPAPVVLTDVDQWDGAEVLPGFGMLVGTAFDEPLRPGSTPGRQPPPAP